MSGSALAAEMCLYPIRNYRTTIYMKDIHALTNVNREASLYGEPSIVCFRKSDTDEDKRLIEQADSRKRMISTFCKTAWGGYIDETNGDTTEYPFMMQTISFKDRKGANIVITNFDDDLFTNGFGYYGWLPPQGNLKVRIGDPDHVYAECGKYRPNTWHEHYGLEMYETSYQIGDSAKRDLLLGRKVDIFIGSQKSTAEGERGSF